MTTTNFTWSVMFTFGLLFVGNLKADSSGQLEIDYSLLGAIETSFPWKPEDANGVFPNEESVETSVDGVETHGGGAWICKNPDGTIRWIKQIEKFEAEEEFGMNFVSHSSDRDSLNYGLRRLIQANAEIGLEVKRYIDWIKNNAKYVKEAPLKVVNDFYSRKMPAPETCVGGEIKYVQLGVIAMKDGSPQSSTIQAKLVRMLGSKEEAAAFLLHEALTIYYAKRGETNSLRVRAINAHLLSDKPVAQYAYMIDSKAAPFSADDCYQKRGQFPNYDTKYGDGYYYFNEFSSGVSIVRHPVEKEGLPRGLVMNSLLQRSGALIPLKGIQEISNEFQLGLGLVRLSGDRIAVMKSDGQWKHTDSVGNPDRIYAGPEVALAPIWSGIFMQPLPPENHSNRVLLGDMVSGKYLIDVLGVGEKVESIIDDQGHALIKKGNQRIGIKNLRTREWRHRFPSDTVKIWEANPDTDARGSKKRFGVTTARGVYFIRPDGSPLGNTVKLNRRKIPVGTMLEKNIFAPNDRISSINRNRSETYVTSDSRILVVLRGPRDPFYRASESLFFDISGNLIRSYGPASCFTFKYLREGISRCENEQSGKNLLLDASGGLIGEIDSSIALWMSSYKNGVARYFVNSKTGFVNTRGVPITPPIFDRMHGNFGVSEGMVFVGNRVPGSSSEYTNEWYQLNPECRNVTQIRPE